MNRKKKKAGAGGNPCNGCGAACCKYFAVYISEPTDLEEFDAIKWYLHHRHVCIYIDQERDWYVHVDNLCKHITREGSCRIYPKRPGVCREYHPDTCEQADTDVENIAEFYRVEELEEFFKLNYRVVGTDLRRRHRRYVVPGKE